MVYLFSLVLQLVVLAILIIINLKLTPLQFPITLEFTLIKLELQVSSFCAPSMIQAPNYLAQTSFCGQRQVTLLAIHLMRSMFLANHSLVIPTADHKYGLPLPL